MGRTKLPWTVTLRESALTLVVMCLLGCNTTPNHNNTPKDARLVIAPSEVVSPNEIPRELVPIPSLMQPYSPVPVAVLTQRYDNSRAGANTNEHVLTVASISSPEFQLLHSIPVDGQVYAQPLLVPQVPWSDGTIKNILIVATMMNTVAAFAVDDALYGSVFSQQPIWSTSLGPPVPANFMPMGYSTWNCNTWASLATGAAVGGVGGFLGGAIGGVVGGGLGALGLNPLDETCGSNADPPSPVARTLPPVGKPPGHKMVYGYAQIGMEGMYNIDPSIGIVSTPVVDSASNRLYAVAKLDRGQGAGPENDIFALDLFTGTILQHHRIDGQEMGSAADNVNGAVIFSQAHQMQRPALLLKNGQLYIAFGSHQDTQPWHGWIFKYDVSASASPLQQQQPAVWCSTPNSLGGSIWQSGVGLTADMAGNIYVMTGNGCNNDSPGNQCSGLPDNLLDSPSSNGTVGDFAESFVQLGPTLTGVLGVSPGDQVKREQEDLDLGSSGPVLVPGTSSLVGGDKAGRLFVLSTSPIFTLTQVLQATPPQSDVGKFLSDVLKIKPATGYYNIHGSPVLWRSPNGIFAYVWAERDVLRAYHWSDSAGQFDCISDSNGCELSAATIPDMQSTVTSPLCDGCMPGGFLSLSADGSTSGTGVVWATLPKDTDPNDVILGGASSNVVPGIVRALDAQDLTKELWNSDLNAGRDGQFMFAKFNPPMVANGRVFVATFGSLLSGDGSQNTQGAINIYGLRQWAKSVDQTYLSTVVQRGGNVQGSVTMFNAGTTTWSRNEYVLTSVDLVGQTANPPVSIPWSSNWPDVVSPGRQITFTFNLPAGDVAQTITFRWKMQQQNVELFGETASRSVQVGGALAADVSTTAAQTTIRITDVVTKSPVPGVSVTIQSTSCNKITNPMGIVACTPTPNCSLPTQLRSGQPIDKPHSTPCVGIASKRPDYADLTFPISSM